MMLMPRLGRWFHCMWHLMRLDASLVHCPVTIWLGWRTVSVRCSCGRIFREQEPA